MRCSVGNARPRHTYYISYAMTPKLTGSIRLLRAERERAAGKFPMQQKWFENKTASFRFNIRLLCFTAPTETQTNSPWSDGVNHAFSERTILEDPVGQWSRSVGSQSQ